MVTELLNLAWVRATVEIDGRPLAGAMCEIYEEQPGGTYAPTQLWAFGTGDVLVQLQSCTLVRTMGALEREVAEGRLVAFPPENAAVVSRGRAVFKVVGVDNRVDAESLVLDVRDVQEQLAGCPSRLERCRDAVREYARDPSDASLARLRLAYGDVPKQMRSLLLGMDAKDHPVRALLSAGTEEERRARCRDLRRVLAWVMFE